MMVRSTNRLCILSKEVVSGMMLLITVCLFIGITIIKQLKSKVLKVKFQNLGENQAEAHFKWDHTSGDYIPFEQLQVNSMPWEVD